MVMDPVPSFDDLIWLFEAEPVCRHSVDGLDAGYRYEWRELWPYTAVRFQTSRAGFEIEMDIEPGYQKIGLRLRTQGDTSDLVSLDLAEVQTVGVERLHGRELLRIDFPDSAPASTLWLRMKPDVSLNWSYRTPG